MKHESEYRDRMDDEDVRSGTGVCCWYCEGTTTSVQVVDIISSTEGNDLVRAARPEMLVLSSSSTARLLGSAAFRNDSRHVERLD